MYRVTEVAETAVWPIPSLIICSLTLKDLNFIFILQQGYRYHKLRNTFSYCYDRHYEYTISKFNVGLKTFLREGLSKLECYAWFTKRN